MHALRDVPAGLPDLRRHQEGAPQPARTHLAHARRGRRRTEAHAGLRRRDELLPRLPGLPDRLPRGRGLLQPARDRPGRSAVRRPQPDLHQPLLAHGHHPRPVHASAPAPLRRTPALALPAPRPADRLPPDRPDQAAAEGSPPTRAAVPDRRDEVLAAADPSDRDAGEADAPRRPADRLRPGPRLRGHQSRHRGRPSGQRLRSAYPARPALLRLAPRPQRRRRRGQDAGQADDRPLPAFPVRRDHHERRRLRQSPAPLRLAAGRRSRLRALGQALGRQAPRHPRMDDGARLPGASGRSGRPHRHLPRLLSPHARPEGD